LIQNRSKNLLVTTCSVNLGLLKAMKDAHKRHVSPKTKKRASSKVCFTLQHCTMAAKLSRSKRGRDKSETVDARNVVAWGCQQGAAPSPNAESILPNKVPLPEKRRTDTKRRKVIDCILADSVFLCFTPIGIRFVLLLLSQRHTAATGVGFELAAAADEAVPWGAWPVRLRQHDAWHFFDEAAGHCDDSNASGSDTDDDLLVVNSTSGSSRAAEEKPVRTVSTDDAQPKNSKTVVLNEATRRPAVVKRYLPKQGGGWKQAAVYRCDEDAANSIARNGSSSSSSSRKRAESIATSGGGAADSGSTAAAGDSDSDADAAASAATNRRKRKRSQRTEQKQQHSANIDGSDDSASDSNSSSSGSGSSGSESGSDSDNDSDSSSSSSSSGKQSASPDAAAAASADATADGTTSTADSTTPAAAAAAQNSQQQQQQQQLVPPLPLRALLRKVWQSEVCSAQAVAYPAGTALAAAPQAGSVLESALLSEIEGTIEAVLWLVMTNWQQQRAATIGKTTVVFTMPDK
jgi:hypothetical protein